MPKFPGLGLIAIVVLAMSAAASPVRADACARVRAVSLNSDVPALITFVNPSPEQRLLYWLDFGGNRQSYGKIDGRSRRTQATFLTHPWLVTTPAGSCIKRVVTRARISVIHLPAR